MNRKNSVNSVNYPSNMTNAQANSYNNAEIKQNLLKLKSKIGGNSNE